MVSNQYFFFQAEDGIRAYKVTGVQTCALPIYRPHERRRSRTQREACRRADALRLARVPRAPRLTLGNRVRDPGRSEERRVGKESRDPWWRQCSKHEKK